MPSPNAEDDHGATRISDENLGFDGPMLMDRYRVVRPLGQGGMGEVCLAYHTVLHREFAIKTIRPEHLLKKPALADRFVREMGAVGKLRHTNVVLATDAVKSDGLLYLIMEYIAGRTLEQISRDHGPLPAADASEMIRQAAEGLAYIHREMIHRDVKPSNLMLGDDGVVKVLDLGLARLHEWDFEPAMTPDGCVIGTYDYMSPEQARGSAEIGPRTDVYSLGCSFFRLLTGRAPYDGELFSTKEDKMKGHLNVPLERVPFFDSVPADLRTLLLRMTAKNVSQRLTAKQVVEQLTPFAAGHSLSAYVGHSNEVGVPRTDAAREEKYRNTYQQPTTLRMGQAEDETPTMHAPTVVLPQVNRRRSRQWTKLGRRWIKLGAIVLALAAAVAFAGSRLAPATFGRAKPTAITPLVELAGNQEPSNSVDDWAPNTLHPLLKERPHSLLRIPAGERTWRYDQASESVEVRCPEPLLLQLGTTTRSQYTFETSMMQVPWTGDAGVFWNYREAADNPHPHQPGKDYATFDLLYLHRRDENINNIRKDVYDLRRAKGTFYVTPRGGHGYRIDDLVKNDVEALGSSPKTLQVYITRNVLSRAIFGGVELQRVVADAATLKAAAHDSQPTGFGFFSDGSSTTFNNARFLSFAPFRE